VLEGSKLFIEISLVIFLFFFGIFGDHCPRPIQSPIGYWPVSH